MDLSLLVKQEMTLKTSPISHVISASYIHYNTHTEVYTHTHTSIILIFDEQLTLVLNIFSHKVKKDPDSPDATPPSTPSSSHSSKPFLQGNGSMDSRTRQRKRKKVGTDPLFSLFTCFHDFF